MVKTTTMRFDLSEIMAVVVKCERCSVETRRPLRTPFEVPTRCPDCGDTWINGNHYFAENEFLKAVRKYLKYSDDDSNSPVSILFEIEG